MLERRKAPASDRRMVQAEVLRRQMVRPAQVGILVVAERACWDQELERVVAPVKVVLKRLKA